MADEIATEGQVETTVAEAAAEAVKATQAAENARGERLDAIEKSLAGLADVVKAAVAPRPVVQSGEVKPGNVPPHFRNLLRQQGLTDADIDANAPIVVPFLAAMLATDGQVMIGGIQQVQDEVEMVKAARNTKKFPYWSEVEDKVGELREEAKKNGQYLTPGDAYKAAVALDVASDTSRIDAARAKAKERASANSNDLSANEPGAHHGSRPGQGGVRRTALTAEDLAAMPREDRKKYFDSIGDRPIR